jgi:hypothetical protein
MTAVGYIAARDALHTLLHGVTSYLTTSNVTDNDWTILDKGYEYSAVLEKGASVKQPSPAGFSSFVYEILVNQFVRFEKASTTLGKLESLTEAIRARIESNPTLLGTKGIIATSTQITAVDKPEPVVLNGVKSDNPPVLFLTSIMHVQIEYRSRITGGEFRS